jgi:hypothetical protein
MHATRIFSVWALLAMAMIANGALRELLLVRTLGRAGADVLSAAIGIMLILSITRPFLRPLAGHAETSSLLTISLAWVLLTVAFEFVFGHYVDHKSWSELAANYAIWQGRLWPIVLLTLAVTPFIWSRPGTKALG